MEEVFILIAEDDADDRFLLQAAFEENGFTDKLHFVENGVEILDYLNSLRDIIRCKKITPFYTPRPQYAQKRWSRGTKGNKAKPGAQKNSCGYFQYY